jgi:hypothetical protein
MNRHETLAKISHYEWMLESMTLKYTHELWIRDQLEDLTASLAQFHTPIKPCPVITETIKSWGAK